MKNLKSVLFIAVFFVLAVSGFKVAGAMTVTGNPVITNITPSEGAVSGTITLNGQNLAGTNLIEIINSSGQIVGSFTIPDASSTNNQTLTFTVPSGLSPAATIPGVGYQIKIASPGRYKQWTPIRIYDSICRNHYCCYYYHRQWHDGKSDHNQHWPEPGRRHDHSDSLRAKS